MIGQSIFKSVNYFSFD